MGIFNEDVEVSEITVGKIDDGQKFITSTGRNEISDDTSVDMFVENPSGATESSYIVVHTLASGDAELGISIDVTQDGTGSALDVINAKTDSGIAPQLVTRTGDSYNINGVTVNINVPGASNFGAGGGGGGSQIAPTTFLMPPGVSMLFRLYNRSGGVAGMGMTMSWFEVNI